MAEALRTHVQRPVTSARVELFEVDTRLYGGPVFRFVNDEQPSPTFYGPDPGVSFYGPDPGVSFYERRVVSFGGQTYQPFPVATEGWAWSGQGAPPTPRISVSNVTNLFSALCAANDDLIGCTVTRRVTYEAFLDGMPDADPLAVAVKDIYRIERKVAQSERLVTFELAAAMDQEGRRLPGRTITQNFCDHVYRRWTGTAFDYATVSCPYTGSGFFDRNDVSASGDPSRDVCGKRFASCIARFGKTKLPFRGFPGVDRFQT